MTKLIDEENYKGVCKLHTPGGIQSVKVVWEPGLYQALSRTNKPKAKPFQKELYEKVLPEIRKTGGYNLKENQKLPQTYLEALKELVTTEEKRQLAETRAEEAEEESEVTQSLLDEAEDTLEAYRAILSPESCLTVGQVAQALNIPKLGRNNLFKYLRRKHFIKQNSQEPYQNRIEQELAVVDLVTINVNHKKVTNPQTKLTFKGLEWLIKKLKANKFPVNTSAKVIWDYYNTQ
jgi:prophage antirepressor-like protein